MFSLNSDSINDFKKLLTCSSCKEIVSFTSPDSILAIGNYHYRCANCNADEQTIPDYLGMSLCYLLTLVNPMLADILLCQSAQPHPTNLRRARTTGSSETSPLIQQQPAYLSTMHTPTIRAALTIPEKENLRHNLISKLPDHYKNALLNFKQNFNPISLQPLFSCPRSGNVLQFPAVIINETQRGYSYNIRSIIQDNGKFNDGFNSGSYKFNIPSAKLITQFLSSIPPQIKNALGEPDKRRTISSELYIRETTNIVNLTHPPSSQSSGECCCEIERCTSYLTGMSAVGSGIAAGVAKAVGASAATVASLGAAAGLSGILCFYCISPSSSKKTTPRSAADRLQSCRISY